MLVEPLSGHIYKMAMDAAVSEIHLEFSGGSDEGCLNISCEPCENSSDLLNAIIEEWAWEVYDYSGAGDGSEYGDNIVYNLVEGTVTTQEWCHERSYGESEELPLVQEEAEEDEPDDASARAAEHTLIELLKAKDDLIQLRRNDPEYAHESQHTLSAIVAEIRSRRTLNAPAILSPPKTYRFWAWVCDGWVRIKLKPEQVQSWGHTERHEEGFSATFIRWEHDGETITEHYSTCGSDCDGRHSDYRTIYHNVSDNAEVDAYDGELDTHGNLIRVPAWQQGEASQYDQYAEMAGY